MKENILSVLKSILIFLMYLASMLVFGLIGFVVWHILGFSSMSFPLLFGQVGSLIFILYYIKKKNINLFKDIQITKKNILITILTVGAILVTQALLFRGIKIENTNTEIIARFSIITKVLMAVILAPLTEELLFRKVLSETMKDTKVFLMCSSILFGLAHFQPFGNVMLSFYVVGVLGLTGLLLGICYLKTKSVVFSMIAHSVFNILTLISYHYMMK